MNRLGIDVGGTHVDFAVVDPDGRLLFGNKVLALGDLNQVIVKGLVELQANYPFDLNQIQSINLGTTLAVNSLLELKNLYRVGLLRLANHQPDLPPAYLWPENYRQAILAGYRNVAGGREYNNQSLKLLDKQELLSATKALIDAGAESLAIIGVFSPLYAEEELLAAEIIKNEFDLPVSLSFQLGSLGFIDRENATLLNAALKKVLLQGLGSLVQNLEELGFKGECHITQNNGSVCGISEAIDLPLKTISSGPTNSLMGASKLAQCGEAIVVDIGGTSTDIGMVENGFPLYSLKGSRVANIPCHLSGPAIRVLAMGGGSLIRYQGDHFSIGPDSLGAGLFTQCQTRGGSQLTLFDIGQRLKAACDPEAEIVMKYYIQRIQDEIKCMLPEEKNYPVLLVGGGAENIPDTFLPLNYSKPPTFALANAYGAALSEVSSQLDCIISLRQDKESHLAELEERVKNRVREKGARADAIRITEKRILPLAYLQETRHRIIISAAGPQDCLKAV